jgi:hypothetical protein
VDKFQLPIRRATEEPVPLRWVYVLERHTGSRLELTEVTGAETFALLHEHTYRNELVHGERAASQHLELCARLVARVRVCRVTRPVETMTAAATADAILAHVAADTAQESA